jgi:hypothetical protein
MMLLSHERWNKEMSQENYDQAWSMVQFLAHAENGKYQGAFVKFMRAIATGQKWDAAWLKQLRLGEGFEKKWSDILAENGRQPDGGSVRPRRHRKSSPACSARDGAEAEVRDVRSARRIGESNEVRIDNRDWLPAPPDRQRLRPRGEDAGAGGEVRPSAGAGGGCR